MRLIVVVAFNVADLIREQSETLRDWLEHDPDGRLVVIDNSAGQETVDTVLEVTAGVSDRVIALVNPRNTGFSPTVNDAVARAEERWGKSESVGLLNPDVSTDADTIGAVFDRLDDPRVGVAAPLLVDSNGMPDGGSLRRHWNRRRLFAEVLGRPQLTRALGSPARGIRPPTPTARAEGRVLVEVDITSGAFMVVRRSVFDRGLDTRLPMYLEDQEICHRADRRGLAVLVDTSLTARHEGGHSRKSNTAMTRQLREMELASAPALSLMDVTGAGSREARIVIGAAAAVRTLIAAAAFIGSVLSPERRRWAGDQARLGAWLVAWAASPRGLDVVDWEVG